MGSIGMKKRWLYTIGIVTIGALALAACAPYAAPVSAGSSTSTVAPTAVVPVTGSTSAPGVTAMANETLDVSSKASVGQFLTDAQGMTLYTFKNDKPGVSNCTGACAGIWPPFVVTGMPSAGSGVTGQIGLITRADGSQQVTYNGMPLYFYQGDKAPGDVNGQGFKNVWYAAVPSASAAPQSAGTPAASSTSAPAMTPMANETINGSSNSKVGQFLTDAQGMTLYIFKKDAPGVSNCSGNCASIWPPFVVTGMPSAGSGVTGQIGLITRSDGSQQVTYNGMPLYFYQGDKAPGDVNGQGILNVWYAASPMASVAPAPTAVPQSTKAPVPAY
jgi:predicted lipoprotein with Yx(FWY)xxD motif